jgi:hypothetical protein
VFPNEWGAEGPAIIGAYGLGLQGWDVSYLFQNRDEGGFSRVIGGQAWDVTAPQVFGLFPAVARQVLRGDVAESDVLAVRNVHVPSLFEGKLGFDDTVVQGYDDKELDSSKVPARALAAARCVIDFTDTDQPTPVFHLDRYEKGGAIVSSTGQLRWYEGREGPTGGYFTMNTPGTRAVVGFAAEKRCDLGTVTIAPQSRFGAIYVTAQEQDGDVDSSRNLLVVAVARARNTGMKLNAEENQLLERGQAPVRMEPVVASIRIDRPGTPKVILLDHDGRPTGRTLDVQGGSFTIDGTRDKTPYYLVTY